MSGKSSSSPHVFRAINRITVAFARAGIPKTHTNAQDHYQYRSIDDLLNRLGPLLGAGGLCILPRVLRREAEDREGERGALLVSVRLLVAFDLVSCRDGSRCTVKAWGEALDPGDKGTAKAMSAAYKGAMLQLFCVPTGVEDADSASHQLSPQARHREPDQGWGAWADEIVSMIRLCESVDALERVRTRQAGLLEALRSERPDRYARIGQTFSCRAQELAQRYTTTAKTALPKRGSSRFQKRKEVSTAEPMNAENTPSKLEKVDE